MLKIIKAEEKHIPAIRELWEEFMHYTVEIDPMFTMSEGAADEFEQRFLRPQMASENALVLVAVDGEKVIAYAVAHIQPDLKFIRPDVKAASIEHVFITHKVRRAGLGEKLYEKMMDWLKTKGVNRLELNVMESNKPGYRFWRKMGFKDFQHTWYREI